MPYSSIKDFLQSEVFYKNKKNLHFYPIENKGNEVCSFDIGPADIVNGHPLLRHAMNHTVFRRFITQIHNYGTFIRFSENKVQRLYWNPPLNAGIPLTAKEKDKVYEGIFLMHDLGHFLLPDLVPTGETDALSKKIYVNWRLLGESITVVLNEMLLVDYLKDTAEFKQMLTLDYDKPYKLFRILKPINLSNEADLYRLFRASYRYFCVLDDTGFMNLIDKRNTNWQEIWAEFDARYRPVAMRGREWTETNFNNVRHMAMDYAKWYDAIQCWEFNRLLNFQMIGDVVPGNDALSDNNSIMELLFDRVFKKLLVPLFLDDTTIPLIDNKSRKMLSFTRYMIGNLFLLIKEECWDEYKVILNKLVALCPSDLPKIKEDYQKCVEHLYQTNRISINEYLNYRNIFIMIPPNILKKDVY